MDPKTLVSGFASFLLSQASGPLLNPGLAEPLKGLMLQIPFVGGWLVNVPATSILAGASFIVIWLIVGGIVSSLSGIMPFVVVAVVVGAAVLLFMSSGLLSGIAFPIAPPSNSTGGS